MIESHPVLTMPPDDAVLWRFTDFTKYVSLLDTGGLFFTQAARMEDNYEGLVPEFTREQTRQAIEAASEQFPEVKKMSPQGQKSLEDYVRHTFCLSCWHMNPHESAAMWKLYMRTDEGIAIRTTFANVKAAFGATTEQVYPAVVKYIDYTKEGFPLNNLFYLVTDKRKSFEHETEVRLIVHAPPTNFKPATRDTPTDFSAEPPGRLLKVSLSDLVQQVYVPPTSPALFRGLVESLTRKYNLTAPVIRSSLYTDPVS